MNTTKRPFHSREPGRLIWESQTDDVRLYRLENGRVRIELPLDASHYDISLSQARLLGRKLQRTPKDPPPPTGKRYPR